MSIAYNPRPLMKVYNLAKFGSFHSYKIVYSVSRGVDLTAPKH